MGGRKKATETEGHGVSALRGNGFDKAMVQDFVKRIDSVQADIDEIMHTAKEECAPLYEDIAGIKREAHDAGIPRRELNAVISERKALARVDAIRGRMTEEQQANFDALKLALGDLSETELGRAARRSAGEEVADGPADVFREAARRYSHAVRAHANARHTERSGERAECALSMMQAIEAEIGRCFLLIKLPDWDEVERAAAGEIVR